jgi:predicted metal-binding membrane protein
MQTHLAAHGERDDGRDGRRWLARAGPALALVGVAAAAWAITVHRMQGMDMGPGTDLGGLGWFAVVWATMMAAMMLPSLTPMVLAAARASRDGGERAPALASAVFAAGYLVVWAGAGVLAYGVVAGVGALHLHWLAWSAGGPYVAGGVIVGAALYELTPVKSACLSHCRDTERLVGRWRPGAPGALLTGLQHGGFCVGSSWALMAALFAIGVMNVTWMAVVTALVAIEKLLPHRRVAIASIVVFIAVVGFAVAFAPGQVPGMTLPG